MSIVLLLHMMGDGIGGGGGEIDLYQRVVGWLEWVLSYSFCFFSCAFVFCSLISSVPSVKWVDCVCFSVFFVSGHFNEELLVLRHCTACGVKLFWKSASDHYYVDFLGKQSVLWFESLFRVSTFALHIIIRLLGWVYNFILLICYPWSSLMISCWIKWCSFAVQEIRNIAYFSVFRWFLLFVLLINSFFFFLNLVVFTACSLKDAQNFFKYLLPLCTSWFFSMSLINKVIVDIEKADEIFYIHQFLLLNIWDQHK